MSLCPLPPPPVTPSPAVTFLFLPSFLPCLLVLVQQLVQLRWGESEVRLFLPPQVLPGCHKRQLVHGHPRLHLQKIKIAAGDTAEKNSDRCNAEAR